MTSSPKYPKRLIEVDLPIKRVSAHARHEKSIRHGHISTLHIWWARRPLAACRAVICAALWPDPADQLCPPAFVDKARSEMLSWTTHERQKLLSAESRPRFEQARQTPALFDNREELRKALLDFIADFANWDNSAVREYLDTSRVLTQEAHEGLGGTPGIRPLVVDPFCGGGAIPLEALRIGADAFASDLNPVPVLLNKVVLEYIPKYGQRLADEVRKWGEWIKREAEKELAEFYPKGGDGATPIAYLWARTIQCEGPGCGTEVPLMRSLWLARKGDRAMALRLVPNVKAKRVTFEIIVKHRDGWVNQDGHDKKIPDPTFEGTVKRGSATCPCCGHTTPVVRVRDQLKTRRGGAHDARLLCVVSTRPNEQGRHFRIPGQKDLEAPRNAAAVLEERKAKHSGHLSLIPNEGTPALDSHRSVASARVYGMDTWADLFTPRQGLALTTLVSLIQRACSQIKSEPDLATAVQVCLALNFGRVADLANSLCGWKLDVQCPTHLFARQAIPMVWDFSESVCISESSGSWSVMTERFADILPAIGCDWRVGQVQRSDATTHPLPNDSAQALVTDPPYYDAVPYAEVSDFFYVWLRRNLPFLQNELLSGELTPKKEQAIVWHPNSTEERAAFERKMRLALSEARRVVEPNGVGVVVFAHKSTSGWEAQLNSMLEAGWTVTASWPIDTESGSRINAMGTASLASSVHLVCRPRENADGSVGADQVGDWRDVLAELPRRIHEWMPRLAEEGVVGADAIFACLGPALEIFSRYSRVEKASGEAVPLKEYLEQVWAAVAKEALTVIFKDADTTGFEEDARLTAMWLWTLNAGNTDATNSESAGEDDADDESDSGARKAKTTGFVLEYDAARKIAQGLGAHLEDLGSLVEISGNTARLMPVAERIRSLFGKDQTTVTRRQRRREPQMDMFAVLQEVQEDGTPMVDTEVSHVGRTTLDRVHQSMILFGAARGEALKRFLVEDAVGSDQRFWRLAQALSALYPASCDEKRWVDGVLARKKALGF